jgi:hypothetical protein
MAPRSLSLRKGHRLAPSIELEDRRMPGMNDTISPFWHAGRDRT